MTKSAVLFSITACSAALTFSLADAGFTYPAIGVALLGAAWLLLYLRRLTRFNGLLFVLFGLIAAASVWAGMPIWYGLLGMLFALLAWDLTAFEESLRGVLDLGDVRKMELAHFTRLFLVLGLGSAGVALSRLITVDLTLGSALVFAILSIWGISALVYRLRSGA